MSHFQAFDSDTNNMRTLVFILFYFLSVDVKATERFEFFNGVRMNGMGGASIGVVNDETALLSNPAGLGKLRNNIATIIDPELTLGSGVADSFLDGTSPTAIFDTDEILSLLQGQANEHIYSKAQVFPSFVTTNFGFGLFKKYEYSATSDATGTNSEFNFYDDTAVVAGFNFRFWDGRIKIGLTGRYINRAAAELVTLSNSSTGNDLNNLVREGTGIAADGALMITAPITWLPSLALVARDIGDTSYSLSNGLFYSPTDSSDPTSTKMTYDAAFSLFPIHSNHVRSSLSFEYRDALNVYEEEDFQRRVHAGYELNVYDILFFRAGYHQRYWTAGFEFAMENIQFQFATYAEDIGVDEEPRENRRYVGKFSFRF